MLLIILGACALSHSSADTGSREPCDSDPQPSAPAPADATCTLTLPPDTWVVHDRVLAERDDSTVWACPGADVSVIGTGNVLVLSGGATGGLSGDANQLLVQPVGGAGQAGGYADALLAEALGAEVEGCAVVRIDASLVPEPCEAEP